MKSWIEQLRPIIYEFRDGEPTLDGDDIDRLSDIIRAKINLDEGNITDDEYNEILDCALIVEPLRQCGGIREM